MTDQHPGSEQSGSRGRFEADQTMEGDPLVLDTSHSPARVVLSCPSDTQAEQIAAILNGERRYSPLAWKIAQRCMFDNPWPTGATVRATVQFAGVLVQGKGPTTTEAMRDLAEHLEDWGS